MSEPRESAADAERAARVEALWREFADPLRRYFRRRVPGDEDAEELLQETFLRVQGAIDSVRDGERYPAWIRRIARNVWVDGGRRRGAPAELDPDGLAADTDEDLDREVAGWIEDVIAELEPLDREVLRRIELGGEPRADVARDLGLTASALKSRVTRGRAKLRARLLDCCAFEFDRRGGLFDVRRRSASACQDPDDCGAC